MMKSDLLQLPVDILQVILRRYFPVVFTKRFSLFYDFMKKNTDEKYIFSYFDVVDIRLYYRKCNFGRD